MFREVLKAYQRAYADLPLEIWMLSAALFVNRFGTMVLPFLTLYLTKSQNYSESAAGWMISIYGVGAVFGTWLGGRWTSVVGAVRLQILLLIASVPLFLVMPFCTSWPSLATVIFLLSLVSEGVRPANATAISQFSSREQRNRSYALQRMAVNLGFSFGPVIGGLLITFNFFWIFVFDAFSTLACAVLLILMFGFKSDSNAASSDSNSEVGSKPKPPGRDIDLLLFLGLMLASAVVFFQFHSTYPLYLSDRYKLNAFQIGLIYAVNTLMVVIFEMILIDYARRWRLLRTIGWGCFLTCLGFGILPFSSAIWFCVLSMIVLTAGEMLSMPLATGWVSQRSEGGNTGAYMGWYSMTYSVAFIIGPAAGGMVYQWSPDLVFHLSTVIGVLVLIGFYLFESRMEKQTA